MAEKEYDYLPPGRRYASRHSTAFAARSLTQMKAMVVYADPEQARAVSHGWDAFRADLVGGEDGGALGALDAIVTRLMRSWHGEAAEAFLAEVERFRDKIADTAEHARYLSIALRGAANALQEYKTHIDAMAPADDAPAGRARISADRTGKVNAEDLLNGDQGGRSAAEQRDLEAAVVMEQLGAAYNSQVKAMGSWGRESLTAPCCPGAPGGTLPLAEVHPIPYSVSSRHSSPPLRPRPAEPPSRTGVGGAVEGLGTRTDTASATGRRDDPAPGVTGGILRQDSAGGRNRTVPNIVLGAALPLQPPGPTAFQGGSGLHRRRGRGR
ncbi:WXG100 family type VII secretion target [Streptomyces sp. SID13726]|uniref:WXG100 family type VII secretion target n=1 Tax=Streptomyces sp. SID13726 TaxID=2706058 RepID=UPI0013BDC3A2|nr:WXG100 family type VII secretion target [Streptomyces sp. SID13726]NEB04315.1 WXG100 family type VII secretion target [Streptomyces sp. SID13726]